VGSLDVGSGNTGFSEFKVYTISLGAFQTKSNAQTHADNVQKKNAGGYIYQRDGAYHVLLSAYEKENDARLVMKNLQDVGTTCELLTITFNEANFYNISSTAYKKELSSSLNIFKTVYLKLYDISISLDTSVMDDPKAKIEVISIKAEVEKTLEEISKGTSSMDGIYYQMVKNKYEEIINILNEVKNYEATDGILLSAKIKYSYLETLHLAQKLIDIINNEK
jgi:hypothetical protein